MTFWTVSFDPGTTLFALGVFGTLTEPARCAVWTRLPVNDLLEDSTAVLLVETKPCRPAVMTGRLGPRTDLSWWRVFGVLAKVRWVAHGTTSGLLAVLLVTFIIAEAPWTALDTVDDLGRIYVVVAYTKFLGHSRVRWIVTTILAHSL